ncbi:MAG: beta-mannosidase [Clostridiales bacterium]|nr:beta-mannosidase [Clostridiales bacterium]
MIKMPIKEGFRMRIVGEETWVDATIPGSVYSDLLVAGRMEDPYWRDNEQKALALMEHDFEYEGTFVVEEEMMQQDAIYLHFDGLDTLADVFLNGCKLGHANNMHRIWEYEVSQCIVLGINRLHIVFYSPTRYIEKAYQEEKIGGTDDAMRGFPKLRKAHCMFGWDWGPRLPDAGIWRDVSLLGYREIRFESVYVTQRHEADGVFLDFSVAAKKCKTEEVISLTEEAGYRYQVQITEPDENGSTMVTSYEDSPESIRIEKPKLWWPNGYGDQPLYTVRVELRKEGVLLDVWEQRIGLRTMTVSREKDAYGESFAHEVNGVKIFAMGADYIPEDNILSRCNKNRTRELLEQCKAANYNTIRVWGGGHYPYDAFWDACDELGLVVWQDFMFACAVYDLTEEFEENIRREFVDNIRRIRHHASLGLWCGNNEMEMFVNYGAWDCTLRQKADYIKMYEYILPKILKAEDPATFYWPASPSSGGSFDEPNDENRGDVHYWDVWHGNLPITEYRKFYFRYLSEFGFQSFPSLKTIETFTEESDRNIFSYVMEKHQRNSSANGKIMNYMEQTFLYPNDFDTLLYASQLLQAEAIRYGVEHFRRNRGRCMGTVVWQLNDCWPVASWSSIDYYGRWKALHYYEKRMFAPLMLSCEEEGILTQDTNPNAQPYEVKKSIRLCVANESMKEETVFVEWELRKNSGEVVRTGMEEITVPKLKSVWLSKVELMEADLYADYVSYHMKSGQEIVSEGSVIFCPPKYFKFQDPKLSVTVEDGKTLCISAKAYAKSVEIRNANDDLILSDNFFDMNPGERRIEIIKGKAEGLSIRSVYNIR